MGDKEKDWEINADDRGITLDMYVIWCYSDYVKYFEKFKNVRKKYLGNLIA